MSYLPFMEMSEWGRGRPDEAKTFGTIALLAMYQAISFFKRPGRSISYIRVQCDNREEINDR